MSHLYLMVLAEEAVVLLISLEVTKCLLSMWRASMMSLREKATLVLDHISHTVMDMYRHSCVRLEILENPNSNEALSPAVSTVDLQALLKDSKFSKNFLYKWCVKY
jgi:hypothetical protein